MVDRERGVNRCRGEAGTGRSKSSLLERLASGNPASNPALCRGQISTILSKGQPHCPRMKAGNTRSYATVHMQRTLSLLSSELRLSNWLGHTLLLCYVCLGEHQCPTTADCRNGAVMGSSCAFESRGHWHVVPGWAPSDRPQPELTNQRRRRTKGLAFISMMVEPGPYACQASSLQMRHTLNC